MLRLLLAISFMIMSMQVFSSDVVTYEKNLKALHLPNKNKVLRVDPMCADSK